MHRLDPQQPQQALRGLVEDPDQPAEQGQVHLGGPGQAAGQRVRVRDREVLGIQLADDHLHHGGHHQHAHGGDAHGDGPGDVRVPEQLDECGAHHRLGHIAHEQAGDGDAQLRTGEHEGGAPGDLQGPLRGGVAVLGGGLQAHPVHGHVRELLGHEEAVGRDDHQDHRDAQDQHQDRVHAAPSSSPKRAAGRLSASLDGTILSPGSSDPVRGRGALMAVEDLRK